MAGLIQQLTDITLTATPSVGSYLLSIDLDGVLKYKTDSGTISPVGGGTTNVNVSEISFGSSSGLTSSPYFTVNIDDFNLQFGLSNSISINSTSSVILGGNLNNIGTSSKGSALIGGHDNIINTTSDYSVIAGGYCNTIYNSQSSSIIAGKNNYMSNVEGSIIGGGCYNVISATANNSSILNSVCSQIYHSCGSVIIGGFTSSIIDNNFILYSFPSSSSIIGGGINVIKDGSAGSSIIGGVYNCISKCSISSTIIGGQFNTIEYGSMKSSIVSGERNLINYGSQYSSIIGGYCNRITAASDWSAIVGGSYHTMSNSCCSVILGGQNLQLTNHSDTVLVPNFFIAGSMSPNNGGNFGLTNDYFVSGFGTFSFNNGVLVNVIV